MTAVLINAAFILLVLTRTSCSVVYVTFLLNCLAAMIWNFGDFMMLATADRFWFYFSLIGTGMIPAVMFHFINALAGSPAKKVWIIAAYALCLPLALSSPIGLVHPAVRSFVDGPVWNMCFFAVLLPLFASGCVILVKAIRKATSKGETSRLQYILIAACIACLSGATDLLQIFRIPIPPLGHLGSVIYSSVLAIGVFKHRAAYDLVIAMRSKLDMLNELAAGMAHELRNPLSSIKGAAGLLYEKAENLSAEKSREYLDLIREEVDRLDGILTNYRSLIRPLKIEREATRINAVIEKTVTLMRLNENALGIELSLSPEVPLCSSDPQTLRQVFINLIQNAHEACGSNGFLHITTEYVPPSIRITFADTGKGVPADILPHIFEPFVSTKTNGMGLGLAICRRLVDLNGGTIDVENHDGGARFTIHLPAGDAVHYA